MNIDVWATIRSGAIAISGQLGPVLVLALGLALAHRLIPMGVTLIHSNLLPRIGAFLPGSASRRGSASIQTARTKRSASISEGGES